MVTPARIMGKLDLYRGSKLLRTVPFVYGATYTYEGGGKRHGEKCMLCFTFDFGESVPVIWVSGDKGTVKAEDLAYFKDPTPDEYERSMEGVDPGVKHGIDIVVNRH